METRSDRNAAGSEARLPPRRLIAFSALMVTVAGAGFPLTAYLPAFYAEEYGIPLTTVGLVFMLVRIFDAAWDPLVGHLSDHGRSEFGRRRIWIAAGLPIYIMATLMLFLPVGTPGFLYLTIGLVLVYGSWTMLQIPYYAWSGELSAQYHERTRIQTYLTVASSSGLMLVLLMPAALDYLGYSAQSMKVAAMGLFIVVSAMIGVPMTLRSFQEVPPPPQADTGGFLAAVRLLLTDRLLMRVLGSDFIVTFGQFARSALMLFFFNHYMNLGAAIGLMFVLQYTFGIVAAPIWLRIGYRLGKHRALILAELLQAAINGALLLVTPGGLWLLIILTIGQGLTQGSGNLMLRAMVADVADKQRLDTGADRTGLFFSVFGLATKASTAVAVGVVLPLVAWLGFNPAGGNDADALFNLKCVFALIPCAAHTLSALLMIGFPLNQFRHAEVRAALAEKDQADSSIITI